MTVEVGWPLAIALVVLVAWGAGVASLGKLGTARDLVWASVRAVVQLAAISLVLTAALQHLGYALLFAAFMFGVAVRTTAKRTGLLAQRGPGTPPWVWSALAMLAGLAPVVLALFGTGTVPLEPVSIIAVFGIIIGNMMTAHTLYGRRVFAALREGIGSYEAMLALGFSRGPAVREVIQPQLAEALVPSLDQTRTVGLVTLPGAFIGVLLGGGSPLQAGAAQVMVLVGVLAGQATTVLAASWFTSQGKLLPADLRARLRP